MARRPRTAHQLAQSVWRVDFSAVDPLFVARCSAGVIASLLVGLAAGGALAGLAATLGAQLTGFGSLQGVYRTRIAAMVAAGAAMTLGALIGGALAPWAFAVAVAVVVCGYAYGVFASLGFAAANAWLYGLIVLVLFSNLHVGAAQVLGAAAWMLGASALQMLLLVVVWPFNPNAAERDALASVYAGLAQYARTRGDLPEGAALIGVRRTLADPQPFGRARERAAFQSLLDEAERVRGSLAALATNRSAQSSQLGTAVAPLLQEIADALHARRAPAAGDDWPRAESATRDVVESRSASARHGGDVAQALLGQVRAAWRDACVVAGAPPAPGVALVAMPRQLRWADALQTLSSNVSLASPFGRHALRLAMTLAVATAALSALHLPRPYWVLYTVLFVMRPDFTATFSRGIARIAGTLLGAAAATAIAAVLPQSPGIEIALVCAFSVAGYAVFSVNYAIYSLTVTAWVVFLLAMLGTPESSAVPERIAATCLGGFLATAAYLLWPTWEARRTRAALADLAEIDRRYAGALLAAYADPSVADTKRIGALQRNAWTLRAQLAESVERTLMEPRRTYEMPPATLLGIAAALRRFGAANLALRAQWTYSAHVSRPELLPFARALDGGVTALVEALRAGTAPRATLPLREAFASAYGAARVAAVPDAEAIFAQCDVLVDSVNTMAGLLTRLARRQYNRR